MLMLKKNGNHLIDILVRVHLNLLSFSRGYGAKSGHEEKEGDDECVNPPKRSSRGRSRHYDDDDENDEERSSSRSKTIVTPRDHSNLIVEELHQSQQ